MKAATDWFEYNEKAIIAKPGISEWCLWSFIIDGKRNYFSGKLFRAANRVGLHIDGYRSFWVDEIESIYWARVNIVE